MRTADEMDSAHADSAHLLAIEVSELEPREREALLAELPAHKRAELIALISEVERLASSPGEAFESHWGREPDVASAGVSRLFNGSHVANSSAGAPRSPDALGSPGALHSAGAPLSSDALGSPSASHSAGAPSSPNVLSSPGVAHSAGASRSLGVSHSRAAHSPSGAHLPNALLVARKPGREQPLTGIERLQRLNDGQLRLLLANESPSVQRRVLALLDSSELAELPASVRRVVVEHLVRQASASALHSGQPAKKPHRWRQMLRRVFR